MNLHSGALSGDSFDLCSSCLEMKIETGCNIFEFFIFMVISADWRYNISLTSAKICYNPLQVLIAIPFPSNTTKSSIISLMMVHVAKSTKSFNWQLMEGMSDVNMIEIEVVETGDEFYIR